MKKVKKETGIQKTNGDFGSDKSGVTVACGCSSCSCMVFIGGGIGGIIGILYGLFKGAMSGLKLAKEGSTLKKWVLGILGSILFAIVFAVIGVLVGGGIGLLVDTTMGNF